VTLRNFTTELQTVATVWTHGTEEGKATNQVRGDLQKDSVKKPHQNRHFCVESIKYL
jgi:hypothetical protein